MCALEGYALILIIFSVVYCIGFVVFDSIITRIRLNISQKEWDEYSSGMTENEKLECFIDFIEQNKIKHGWEFLYIPKM